jgi:hypothetical protein
MTRNIPLVTVTALSALLAACSDDTMDTAETGTPSPTTVPTLTPTTDSEAIPTTAPEPDSTSTTDGTTASPTTTPPPGTSSSETTADPSTDPSGDPTTDPSGDPSTDPSGDPEVGCSDDLHDVIDGMGNVIETCPSDQACAAGMCILACDAAAAIEGTIGCDFWAPTPPFVFNGTNASQDGPCHAVFLANAWNGPAKVTISRAGQTFDASTYGRIPQPDGSLLPVPPEGIPPDQVAILFLSHDPTSVNGGPLTCPVQPAVLADTAVPGAGIGDAFHVVSDVPVSAYDILPYGGASSYLPSASLLLPATTWGTNHMAIAPQPSGYTMWTLVVAREDNTIIKVAPPVAFPGGGVVAPAPAAVTTEYTLNAGQILQWAAPGNAYDPSGAIFDSDKPIGLWTGNTYLFVTSQTSGGGGGECAHQQIAPVQAMGSEYVGAGLRSRIGGPESVPYRMVGAVADTTLTWDPAPPAGAPPTLAAGQIVQFESSTPFTVRSQDPDHPFLFSEYMPGANGAGDEEWVSLLSSKQFQNRYIFFTDPTYGNTNLVIVRARENNAFSDVTVECLGVVSGWQPIGAEGLYEFAHVDLEVANTPVAQCGTSRHLAESAGPFGIVVWGTDSYASYGYPAGSDISKITDIELPVPG